MTLWDTSAVVKLFGAVGESERQAAAILGLKILPE